MADSVGVNAREVLMVGAEKDAVLYIHVRLIKMMVYVHHYLRGIVR